jgi:perosamine synthetase
MTSQLPETTAPASDAPVPLCVPHLGGNEWAYVKECLDTNWVSSVGPYVDRFERAVAERVGAPFAVATASGTAALHVALLVAGVEPDDEVIVPAITFIAPANAVRYVGAWPTFVDVDPAYWQIDVGRVAAFLAAGCTRRAGVLRNRVTGRRVRALLPVDVFGHPADLEPLTALAREHGLATVEDASESLGARYRGRPVGSLGDLGCFSFNGNKLITTGGGGMLVTGDAAMAKRAKYLATQAKDDPIEFVHGEVGYNYRLTNVQAAIGLAQLERLDEYVAAKRRIAQRYAHAFDGVAGVELMAEAPWAFSTHWMFTLVISPAPGRPDVRDLIRTLGRRRIECRPVWEPLHRSRAHRAAFATPCPVAERVYRSGVCLPCSVGLTPESQDRVIAAVLEWLAD